MRKSTLILGLPLIAMAVAISTCGCDHERLASQWRRDAVTVDGDDSEWQQVPRYALDQGTTAVSLQHDSAYLYLLFKTRDQSLLPRIAAGGLQVWLDPYARKARTFGVRYPATQHRMGPGDWAAGGPDTADSQRPRGATLDTAAISRVLADAQRHIIITGPEQGECCTLSVARADSFGIRAGVKLDRGILACELQLPLREDRLHPYAIAIAGRDTLQTVGIWLEAAAASERGGARRRFMNEGKPSSGPPTTLGDDEPVHPDFYQTASRLDFWSIIELRFPPPDQR